MAGILWDVGQGIHPRALTPTLRDWKKLRCTMFICWFSSVTRAAHTWTWSCVQDPLPPLYPPRNEVMETCRQGG